MVIGRFRYNLKSDSFNGYILMLNCNIGTVTVARVDKPSKNAPDYRITAATDSDPVELGAAWRRIGKDGKPFISVELDCPLFEKPINAILSVVDDGEKATLFWSRKKP